MKRATLLLEDNLYDRAKKLSKERGQTLKEVVNELLRIGLSAARSKKPVLFELPLYHTGPLPGVDIADRNALYDLMEDR